MRAELTYDSTSKFVKLPSGRVHYNVAGEGHPVILLHGSGPRATGWGNFGPNIGHLAERFSCYDVDMPGWGESDTVRPEQRNHVQTALELMDELGLERGLLCWQLHGWGNDDQVRCRAPGAPVAPGHDGRGHERREAVRRGRRADRGFEGPAQGLS